MTEDNVSVFKAVLIWSDLQGRELYLWSKCGAMFLSMLTCYTVYTDQFSSSTSSLFSFQDSLNQFTSIFCLMVMSIDRYLAVVHPIRSTKWRKPRVAKLINLTVWGVSLIVILPAMIFSGLNKVPVCGIVWPEPQDIYYKAFIFYTFFIGFFLPLSVICLCYLLIIIKVRAQQDVQELVIYLLVYLFSCGEKKKKNVKKS